MDTEVILVPKKNMVPAATVAWTRRRGISGPDLLVHSVSVDANTRAF